MVHRPERALRQQEVLGPSGGEQVEQVLVQVLVLVQHLHQENSLENAKCAE